MLDTNLKEQLKQYLQLIKNNLIITVYPNQSQTSKEMLNLMEELKVSPLINVIEDNNTQTRRPSFKINPHNSENCITFAGLPMGHEFTSLVLALLHLGGHTIKWEQKTINQIKKIKNKYHFETFFSQSCQNCPDLIQALNTMSALNVNITHTAIDGASFQEEVKEKNILAVPAVYLNGELFAQGKMDVNQILEKIDTSIIDDKIEELNNKDIFDTLIIGGGPAGISAAIYASRKGINVGLVTKVIGGQVNDTMSIENYISIPHTEGPKLVNNFKQHIKDYPIDCITNTEVVKMEEKDNIHYLTLDNGAILKSRTIIISSGAQWRQTGVEGENEYRNKGVTYCPHCDGPLFKGKDVVVIGGGNSGVEAAIDLSGITKSVTLIEYNEQLKADKILQDKLNSISNSKIITNAQLLKIEGNGNNLTNIIYKDRKNNNENILKTDGMFVQIGLIPNSTFSQVEKNSFGEIIIDNKNQTNIKGVFACGDVTNEPYKQIIVAAGSGAKAALSAFEYLINN